MWPQRQFAELLLGIRNYRRCPDLFKGFWSVLVSEGAWGFLYIVFWAIYGKISSKLFFFSCPCGKLKRKEREKRENILCPDLVLRTKAATQTQNFMVTNIWGPVATVSVFRACEPLTAAPHAQATDFNFKTHLHPKLMVTGIEFHYWETSNLCMFSFVSFQGLGFANPASPCAPWPVTAPIPLPVKFRIRF